MKRKTLIVSLLDLPSIKRDSWHFLSDYVLFLDNNLFALLRGIIFNLISGRLSIAYIYKGCTFYSFKDIKFGNNVIVKKKCRIKGPAVIGIDTIIDESVIITGPVVIGDHCHINYNAWIDKEVTIGNRVGIGHRSFLVTFNHEYSDPNWRWGGKLYFKPICISDGAWIGANVVILRGVNIGKGAIVGAGSVVTKDIPECMLVGGNPARVIKKLANT